MEPLSECTCGHTLCAHYEYGNCYIKDCGCEAFDLDDDRNRIVKSKAGPVMAHRLAQVDAAGARIGQCSRCGAEIRSDWIDRTISDLRAALDAAKADYAQIQNVLRLTTERMVSAEAEEALMRDRYKAAKVELTELRAQVGGECGHCGLPMEKP